MPRSLAKKFWFSAIISLLILQSTVVVNWDTLDRTVRMIVQLNATILDDMLWHS